MALNYVNRTTVQLARNGTTSFTINFAAAKSGNLLVAVLCGGVTETTPTGWTFVNSTVANQGCYIWRKTASAAESSAVTTANGSDYPIGGIVYEFAAGSTVDSSVTSGASMQAATAANPSITPSSAQVAVAVAAYTVALDGPSWTSMTWSSGTEDFDLYTTYTTTDGYLVSGAWIDGTGSAYAPTTTPDTGTGTYRESMSMALTVVAPSSFIAGKPHTIQQAVTRSYTY